MNTPQRIVNDHQIRTALKSKVLRRYLKEPDTVILNELGIWYGTTRIDIAIINGQMHGIEIKSDVDTLARLPLQVKVYSAVFDRITLVVGPRHTKQAMRLVPDWWGVKLVEVGACGAIRFQSLRTPLNNLEVDPLALAALLWRDEALTFLDDVGAATGLCSKPRAAIYARLIEVVNLDQLRTRVRQQLKTRVDWRADKLLASDDG